MLKIVPDPPHSHAFLEDTLVQISEHLHCALAVAHQSVLLCSKSPGSMLMLAAVHEMETLRALLESALAQVQQAVMPKPLH
ncbi:hypothetical protein RTH46_16935 [Pseudomonas sp. zfem004]|uniref:hypothetical protein n=1 Tax=unclassified Pseudomonas TaxID=196821 RepID=UPI00129AF441|nr:MULTISPECIES: hypothetical protein [unclassified Pseudomonas]MDU9404176.1 hypothetical protein [Pseudomonas sp. zfem004]